MEINVQRSCGMCINLRSEKGAEFNAAGNFVGLRIHKYYCIEDETHSAIIAPKLCGTDCDSWRFFADSNAR